MPDTTWFTRAKFGLMAHWGVYSALGRGEWVLNRERMPLAEYQAAAAGFTAEHFDADAWAQLAVDAGQRYFIVTAKHHDGFCLWRTRTTRFNAVDAGPRRDLVAELVAAFHKRGLKVGFFFSLADWSHPDYPTPYATDWPERWASDQARRNVAAYDLEQLRELTTQYGPIDVMWFDGAAPGMSADEWQAREIFELCYRSNPHMLLNNRLFLPGDFDAMEVHLQRPPGQEQRPWETDYPLNDSWAFNPDDRNWKPPHVVWQRLLSATGRGGNLLLNVSPRADGTIPQEEQDILRAVGRRIARLGGIEAVDYGPEATHLRWLQGMTHTIKGNALFIHAFYRHGDELAYGSVRQKPLRAVLVDDGRELPVTQDATSRLRIGGLAGTPRDAIGHCIRLDFAEPPTGFGVGHQNLNF